MTAKKQTEKEKETPNPRMVSVGARLKEIRLEKGYSSYDHFAWEHKISVRQYYNMEQGKNFTMASLLRVLDAHGITLEEFFKGLK